MIGQQTVNLPISKSDMTWFGSEFYTSISQWFATQWELNDTLKEKNCCVKILILFP